MLWRAMCLSCCGFALVAGGCANRPKIPAEVAAAPKAFELLEQMPAGGFIRASDVYDARESSHTWLSIDESGRELGPIEVKRSATDRLDAAFTDDEGTSESELWRLDEQGNVVMVAHVDEQEKTVTHFRPPLIVMPPELRAHDTFTSEAAMRVVDLNNPLKLREQGQARRAVSYVGDQRLRTARGEFTAQRLEIKFIADLRLADAEERTILFIVPGEGVIARQTEVKIKILGALSKTDRRTLVRTE